jgi:hypothetical protein
MDFQETTKKKKQSARSELEILPANDLGRHGISAQKSTKIICGTANREEMD